jgi:hypothetical protein
MAPTCSCRCSRTARGRSATVNTKSPCVPAVRGGQPIAPPQRLQFLGHRLGHRVFGVILQRRHHGGHGHASGAGIPNAEGAEAVGVDMFRAFNQLRKGGDRRLGGRCLGGMDIQQHRAIALDDQGIVRAITHDKGKL